MFEVYLSSHAKRFLKKAQREVYNRIMKKIKELSNNPFPPDMRRVVGRKEKVFRVRVGNYRILYVIFHEKNELLISDIDKRGKVY